MAALQLHALFSYRFLFVDLPKQGLKVVSEESGAGSKPAFGGKTEVWCLELEGCRVGSIRDLRRSPSVTLSQIYRFVQTLLVFPVSSPTPQGADQLIGWSLHFSTIER